MAKFDIILFDADDTLLDFAKDEEQALTQTLIEYGIDCNDSIKERYKSINEALWKAFENGEVTKEDIQNIRFTKLFQELAIDKDGYKCNTDYLEALGYGSFLIPGAKEICGELRKMCRLYIVTNGISRTQYRRFNNSGINKFFTDIFVSEDSGYQKPQIEFFDYVFDKIGKLDKS
ncbi:YjjG family noncanonical pyrimidine nucleotidase [Clostridium polynesiense]|uniref:YjjG family noncanonical pyrimidine nucleotidase n=1 Tax=Clostridium polynesiense TaxID=1325933 RepID=UPI000A8AB174|nr:YjjG family noncanonical pyrimidine nucleotidase [Clostridium polynesiense]